MRRHSWMAIAACSLFAAMCLLVILANVYYVVHWNDQSPWNVAAIVCLLLALGSWLVLKF